VKVNCNLQAITPLGQKYSYKNLLTFQIHANPVMEAFNAEDITQTTDSFYYKII